MEKEKKITGFLLAVILLFSFSLCLAAEAEKLKIRVTVATANVRLKPGLDSQVIGKARNGQVFDVVQKTGDWYLINLPPDDKGIIIAGYIHKSIVEELAEEPAVKKEKKSPEEKPEIREKPPVSRPPVVTPPAKPKAVSSQAKKKFYLRLGGGYSSKTYSYANNWNFSLYYEDGAVHEDYLIDSSGVAVDAGIGYYFMGNAGIELSYIPGTGKSSGTFSAAFPHPLYFSTLREKTWENTALKYSASELNLNLVYSIDVSPRFKIYLTGGGTYFINVQIENLKIINWNETGYPYFDVSVSPEYAAYSNSCFGFNAGGGLDFFFTPGLGVNLNVRYSDGEARIQVEETEFAVKAGGLRATAGIKFAF